MTIRSQSRRFTLTLNAPIATKVVCFSRLLKCLRSLYGKQCGPRSECSYGSSLFWVHAVRFYTLSVMSGNYMQQTTSADDIFRCIFFFVLLGLKPVWLFAWIFSLIRVKCAQMRTHAFIALIFLAHLEQMSQLTI